MTFRLPVYLVAAVLTAAGSRLAIAEDIKTTNGVEYKGVTITRSEPDGIVIAHAAGIVKIPFTELPESVRNNYGYDPTKAAAYSRELAARQSELRRQASAAEHKIRADKFRQAAEGEAIHRKEKALRYAQQNLGAITIYAIVEPFRFHESHTTAWIQRYERIDTGMRQNPSATSLNMVPVYSWRKVGRRFVGVIAESMPDNYERGDKTVLALYKLGHTRDSSRDPLFTTSPEKAAELLAAGER